MPASALGKDFVLEGEGVTREDVAWHRLPDEEVDNRADNAPQGIRRTEIQGQPAVLLAAQRASLRE